VATWKTGNSLDISLVSTKSVLNSLRGLGVLMDDIGQSCAESERDDLEFARGRLLEFANELESRMAKLESARVE
jgi:hypothetical protein